jgi:hypothetical protein
LAVGLALLALALVSVSAQAQQLDWALRAGGPGFDDGTGIAVDGAGNSYVTGSALFLAKYDSNGNVVWSKTGPTPARGVDIAVDGEGNSYVTGRFVGTATFGEGAGSVTLTSAGIDDLFVAKYDGNGDLVWAKRAGGPTQESGWGIAVDGIGNSYVTGNFGGTATFGEGTNSITLTSTGTRDIFVARYDSNGNLVWIKQAGGTGSIFQSGLDIALDGLGNSHVSGRFAGMATFGQGASAVTLTGTGNSLDIFVAKYDNNGNLLWAKQAGGISFEGGEGIAVDNLGNSYVTGGFGSTATFGEGSSTVTLTTTTNSIDIFVAKYDSNGALLWAKQAGGSASDVGFGIDVDGTGSGYVTGRFGTTTTFGEGDSTTLLTSAGSTDIFVAKYGGNGDLFWVKRAGGTSQDESFDIAVNSAGNSHIIGRFFGTATFGQGASATTLTTVGGSDIFVAKYIDNSPPTADTGGPYSTAEGTVITLNNASAVDEDGDSLAFSWTVDMPLCIFSDPAILQPTITCSDDGTYIVTLSADDGVHEPVSSNTTVNVENVAPTINSVSNDGPLLPGASATITVMATDPAGSNDPLQYGFDCDDDGVFEVGPQPDNTAACSFGDAGNFTVNVHVTDDEGGQTLGSTAVTVLTPQEAGQILINQVQVFVDAGVLNQGQGQALIAKLEAAIQKLDQDNVRAAINQLEAFSNQVSALINGGVLTSAEGQPVIEAVTELIVVLKP